MDRHNSRLFEANKKEGLPGTVEWPTTDKCPEIANVREGGGSQETTHSGKLPHPAIRQIMGGEQHGAENRTQRSARGAL